MSRTQIHRARYQEIRDNAYNNTVKKITYKDVKQYAEDATQDMAKMQRTGVFQNLEETDFYRDKFVSLQNAMKIASKNKMSMKEFTTQTQEMFKQRNYAPRNSYLNQAATDPKITSEPAAQNRMLQSFFQQKKSKIVPDMGFRSLLENPPVTNKNFKKRVGENRDEIDRLRRQNQQLKRQLQNGNFGNSNLSFQIRKQQERIRYLQTQNERMERDNTRLRSQKSVTVVSSKPTYDDYLYSPYVLNPRQNDLVKIVSRTSQIDTTSYYNQNFSERGNLKSGSAFYYNGESPSFNNKTNTNRNHAYSQFGDERNDGEYSVFDQQRSRLSEYGGLQDSYRLQGGLGVDDGKTASRNKVAFFKNEGVIIRNQEMEIGYKRSEDGDLSMNRLILYLNNKTGKQKQVQINYKYEQQYFSVNISQKLNNIEPFKQARQVVEVRLSQSKQDINSLMEAEISVNEVSYKIWMPLMFIRFTNARNSNQFSASTRVVNPSRIFSNEYDSKKLIPSLMTTNKGQAVIWGKSAVHEGPIKLHWISRDRLQITTSEKWMDIISFLVFDYQ